jgi:uncharacterized protein (UPF0332 family)
MSNSIDHIKKFESNKNLIETDFFNSSEKWNDWKVTITFYSALHLIQSKLIEKGVNPKGHKKRNNMVSSLSEFKRKIKSDYFILYNESIKARYECIPIDGKVVSDCLECLKNIEKELYN